MAHTGSLLNTACLPSGLSYPILLPTPSGVSQDLLLNKLLALGFLSQGLQTERGRKIPWSMTRRVHTPDIYLVSAPEPHGAGLQSWPLWSSELLPVLLLGVLESMGHGGVARFTWEAKVKGIPLLGSQCPSSSFLPQRKPSLVCLRAHTEASNQVSVPHEALVL